MTINGLGTPATLGRIRNENLITASLNGGTITLDCRVSDNSAADEWHAISGSNLLFAKAATSLNGQFVILGTITVNANVHTCGMLEFHSGASIDVNGTYFKYQSFSSSSTCANPANSGTGTDCDTDSYTVDTDIINCS